MQKVAPCVGAWIETLTEQLKEQRLQVAPCVGAWIETETKAGRAWRTQSRPAWARGLKLALFAKRFINVVAPCVGAWIETG